MTTTCFTCEYYDGKRCTNRDSDHYSKKVAPTGSCLDYEPDDTEDGDNIDKKT